MFNGYNGLLGYDKEIVDEVENMQFYITKNKNGENNYIRDNFREDKGENLNILK